MSKIVANRCVCYKRLTKRKEILHNLRLNKEGLQIPKKTPKKGQSFKLIFVIVICFIFFTYTFVR